MIDGGLVDMGAELGAAGTRHASRGTTCLARSSSRCGSVGRPENRGAAMRFVYCYSMKDDPAAVRELAPKHAAYWHELGLAEYIGGPFADRSGGLISFE